MFADTGGAVTRILIIAVTRILIIKVAGDPRVMRKSGKALHVGELAREYGFTDIDGRRVPPFIIREPFLEMVKKIQKP